MADNCCNPVTPPSCVTRCQQLINACCVVNVDNLPCINPPIQVTGAGTKGQDYLTLSEVIEAPDSGTYVVTDASGCIPANTEITEFHGVNVILSNAVTCTFTANPITVSLSDQRQCDINKAFDEKLCQLGCPVFEALPQLNTDWQNSTYPGSGPGEVSNVVGCIVRFKGGLEFTFLKQNSCTTYGGSILAGTLPVALRPSAIKALSVNLYIVQTDPGEDDTLIIPAILSVTTAGQILIGFNLNNGCIKSSGLKLYLSLDGLTYEII